MEIKEAIWRLKEHFRVHDDGRPTPKLDEACKIAYECMEKQLPKKPKHIHTKYRKHSWKKKVDGSIDMEAFDGDIHGCAAECERCGRLAFYENLLESDGCEINEYFCQSCNRKIKKYDKSCDCGQKIDWSE